MNVQFVWCPNYWVTAWGDPSGEPYYPGDAYVDWVALDGYNTATPNWVTFSQLFSEDYTDFVTNHPTKPMMIAEVASTEPTAAQAAAGASKAQWFTQTFAAIQQSFPQIRALVYFNEDKTQAESCNCHWPIESDSAAQAAYKQAVAPSWFLPSYP
jgi:beta-mannanase